MSDQRSQLVYIGTYTQKSEGIYLCRLDLDTGELSQVRITRDVENPSWLELSPDGRYLYAVNEVDEFEGVKGGGLSAYAVSQGSGELALLCTRPTYGDSPCYVSLDSAGRWAFVANYMGGSLSIFPLDDQGRPEAPSAVVQHEGKSVHPERQTEPHVHCVVPDPRGAGRLMAVDLGLDKIKLYQLEIEQGALAPHEPTAVDLKPGVGPRHLRFHPDGRFAYLSNELASSITVFAYDADASTFQELETISSLPADFKGENTGAELVLDQRGRFLYMSNRGHDSIAIFAIDQQSGRLTSLGHTSSGGQSPRHFALDPSGSFLVAAHQKSDSLVSFRVDPASGQLTPTGHRLEIPTPVCVRFVGA